jgi:hypothetical protein
MDKNSGDGSIRSYAPVGLGRGEGVALELLTSILSLRGEHPLKSWSLLTDNGIEAQGSDPELFAQQGTDQSRALTRSSGLLH